MLTCANIPIQDGGVDEKVSCVRAVVSERGVAPAQQVQQRDARRKLQPPVAMHMILEIRGTGIPTLKQSWEL